MKYTREEWLEELKKRFGSDPLKWVFQCPACGRETSLEEFKKAGADPNDGYQNCIGRFTGKGPASKASKDGCDWAAYGLLGHLGRGDEVIVDSGKTIQVFKMAKKKNI